MKTTHTLRFANQLPFVPQLACSSFGFRHPSTCVLKDLCRLLVLSGAWGGALALGGEAPVSENAVIPQEAGSPWYLGVRAIVGGSDEETSFQTLPDGATGGDEDSHDTQENAGAEIMLGYCFSVWGLPLRAELSGGMLCRHDADMEASGLANPFYENNLRIWDARLSLFADVANFGWGRFYAGAGLGAAYLDSEVSIVGLNDSADHGEWNISPSAQAGFIFDDVIGRMDVELAYRLRWFGDTESGTFPDNAKINYENTYIHELIVGVIFPLGQ